MAHGMLRERIEKAIADYDSLWCGYGDPEINGRIHAEIRRGIIQDEACKEQLWLAARSRRGGASH